MCAELGYQSLLSDSALSCVMKAALENAYPKIRGRMPVTAEALNTHIFNLCLMLSPLTLSVPLRLD